MRLLLSVLLLTVSAWGQATNFHISGIDGGKTVFRGSRLIVTINGGWYVSWRTVTVDTATDTFTLAGHGFVNNSTVCFRSVGGTVPVPLATMFCHAAVTPPDADHFQVREIISSYPAIDITTAGTGTIQVGVPGSNGSSIVNFAVSDPTGITHEAWRPGWIDAPDTTDREHPGWVKIIEAFGYTYPSSLPKVMMLGFTASPTAPLGPATVTVTLTNAIFTSAVVSIPINIVDKPVFNVTRPAAYPAIPGLAVADRTMLTLASRNCVKSTGLIQDPSNFSNQGAFVFSNETQIWYYDGGHAMDKVADYSGDTEWRNCGKIIIDAYRDNALAVGVSGVAAFRLFVDGLSKRFRETRDGRYRYAVRRLATGVGAFSLIGAYPDTLYARENAYVLSVHVANARLRGEPLSEVGQRSADMVMSVLDQTYITNAPPSHQVFMDALQMKELINYWELTGDARAPYYIKAGLDWWWTNAHKGSGNFTYNPRPFGSGCFYIEKCITAAGDKFLTGLTLPAYGWYYSVTGDTTYSTRGDELFQNTAQNIGPDSVDDVTDTLTMAGHPFVNGQVVLSNSTFYVGNLYVRNSTATTFQLSTSAGGAILNIPAGVLPRNVMFNLNATDLADKGKDFGQNFRWLTTYVEWRRLQR